MSQPMSSKHDGPFPERVGIVGSGTIACGVAACVAGAGGDVTLWARSEESAARARGELDGHSVATAVETDVAALSEATLIVEAVTEQPGPKEDVYRAVSGI